MLASTFLTAVALLATGTFAAPAIVGTVACAGYADGNLDYSNSSAAPLAGWHTNINVQQDVLVDTLNTACKESTGAQVFQFQTCNSSFMGYEQSANIHYGIVIELSSKKCLAIGSDNVLTLQECTYSDDSGQVLQYWAVSSTISTQTLSLLREQYNGTNPLGENLVPTAPPSPLPNYFIVELAAAGATVENQLYLESVGEYSC